jgi:PKD repeat protein
MRQVALGLLWIVAVTMLAGCPADTPPLAAFRAFPSAGEEPLSVQFTDFSLPGGQPIRSWLWDFGDGEQSTAQNPLHVYPNPGTYDVSLTVTTAIGSDSEVIVNHIRVSLGFQIHVLNESVFPVTELYVVDADASSLGANRLSRIVAPDSGRTLATKYTKGQQIVAAVVLADDVEVGLPVQGNLQTLEMPDDFVTLYITGDSIDTLTIDYFYGLP